MNRLVMTVVTRRSQGEGALYWHEGRQRWVAMVELGFTAEGKRRRVWVSGRTKTEAKGKLLSLRRDQVDGLPPQHRGYTVREAVESWLEFGLTNRDPNTVINRRILAEKHVIPAFGARKLVDLTAEQVEAWLGLKARTLSTDTVNRLLSILRRSIGRAQARDLVRRNVALLCAVPQGQAGRPSKALTLDQAHSVIAAAEGTTMHAYVVVALFTGARTEELRALTWGRVHLDSDPPSLEVWRSVRRSGDTKTARSRRTLELPRRCVDALRAHHVAQVETRVVAGSEWIEHGLVFCTGSGRPLDAANVRRSFRTIVGHAGLDGAAWTPRELRHSFVSLLSSSGVPIEDISHLVGHASSNVTEKVYRKELRPVLTRGARAMDGIFDAKQAD